MSSSQLTDAAMATRSVPNGRTVGNGRFQVQLFKLSYVRNEVVYSLYIVGTCVAYVKWIVISVVKMIYVSVKLCCI